MSGVLLLLFLSFSPAHAAPADPRAEIKRAFLTGAEGPDPESLRASGDPRAEELRALAAGLRALRAGTTLDRVADFSYALDPVSPPMPEPEVLSRYLRAEAVAAARGAVYSPERAERFRARLRTQIANLSSGLAEFPDEGPGAPGDAAPYRAPAPEPRRRELPLSAAPPLVSPERGAVVPAVNGEARAVVAGLDDRLEDLSGRRAAAWREGRPFEAAGLAVASVGGHIVEGTWSLVAGATGRDSAKNIARAVLSQPAAVLDYRERQAAVARPGDDLAGYLIGTSRNLAVLAVETVPGGRAAGTATRATYGALVRDARDSFHALEEAEAGLAAASRRLESSAAGSAERAALEREAAAARARFELKRAELDASRKAMVEHRMARALDHDFHGKIETRLLDRSEASELNARFVREGGSPPFHEGVPVYRVTTTEAIDLCRTHRAADLSKLRAMRSANGDWFIPCETYHHFDQKHLRDLLALPDSNAVDFVARYRVPAGTRFYVGAAGPIRGETAGRVETMYTDQAGRAVGGGGNGGKVQFFLDPHINDSGARDRFAYQRSSPVPRDHELLHPMEAFRKAAEAKDADAARRAYADLMRRRRGQADLIRRDDALRLDYERIAADMRETFPAAF
ncbi:MAG: hypothetical protein HYX59_14700 [Elusimicrobia bacterium]|nr:hypothetical protein [Elusimicrobiota bacterium]